MPLIYAIHAAVIAIGGMGDLTFRVFDLGSSVVIGILAAALVWPAGRSLGILAALSIVTSHLFFGPLAAGQRDYLMLVPTLAAAWCAARAAEQPAHHTLLFVRSRYCQRSRCLAQAYGGYPRRIAVSRQAVPLAGCRGRIGRSGGDWSRNSRGAGRGRGCGSVRHGLHHVYPPLFPSGQCFHRNSSIEGW